MVHLHLMRTKMRHKQTNTFNM